MANEPTCGEGLAEHAAVPQVVAELLRAVSDNLVAHLTMLAGDDDETQREAQVYERLSERHREAAATLDALATEMADQVDLPMGEHDFEAMSLGDMRVALERLIAAESILIGHLERQLDEHRSMIEAMDA